MDYDLKTLVIEWVDHDTLWPNKYNPNRMEPEMHRLLTRSILEDGWTQPIVVLKSGMIIDGEQRWTVAQSALSLEHVEDIIEQIKERRESGAVVSEEILNRLEQARDLVMDAVKEGETATLLTLTDGQVPVTVVPLEDEAHQMIATIRHNRARGTHAQDKMAVITHDLLSLGLEPADLEERLGLKEEDVHRLFDRAEGMWAELDELEGEGWSDSWNLKSITDMDLDEITALEQTGLAFSEEFKKEKEKENGDGDGHRLKPGKIKLLMGQSDAQYVKRILGEDVANAVCVIATVFEQDPEKKVRVLGPEPADE